MTQVSSNAENTGALVIESQAVVAGEPDTRVGHEKVISGLRLLWQQQRFLWRVTACGLLMATAIAFLIPKQYESSTRLMPPDHEPTSALAMAAAFSSRAGGLGGFAGDLLGLKSSGALFVGILCSRTVQDRLVGRFDLKKVYGVRLAYDARKELAQNTAIADDRKSGIITITVTDKSRERAAALAGAYVEELDRLVGQLSTSAAHRERVFLEERLKVVKLDLDSAAKEFGKFASKNAAIDIKEQGKAMVEAAATLQGQLIAYQSELKGWEQIYTDSNVRVRAVRARIAELQRQLEKLGGKETGQADSAGPPEEALYPSIRKLPLLGVTYADLYRRTKIQEAVYETLTQQYELAKVQEAKETPSVRVLDGANVPEKKSYPPRLLIMFLGTILSFTVAVALVLGNARWEGADPQDPRKIFAQEVFEAVKTRMPWASHNGSHVGAGTSKLLSQFGPGQDPPRDGE